MNTIINEKSNPLYKLVGLCCGFLLVWFILFCVHLSYTQYISEENSSNHAEFLVLQEIKELRDFSNEYFLNIHQKLSKNHSDSDEKFSQILDIPKHSDLLDEDSEDYFTVLVDHNWKVIKSAYKGQQYNGLLPNNWKIYSKRPDFISNKANKPQSAHALDLPKGISVVEIETPDKKKIFALSHDFPLIFTQDHETEEIFHFLIVKLLDTDAILHKPQNQIFETIDFLPASTALSTQDLKRSIIITDVNNGPQAYIKWVEKNTISVTLWLILIGGFILTLLFSYIFYLLIKSLDKAKQITTIYIENEKNQLSRMQEQKEILLQLSANSAYNSDKINKEYLPQICEALAQGTSPSNVFIFCQDDKQKAVQCVASYPNRLVSTYFLSNTVTLKQEWPLPQIEEEAAKTFLIQHFPNLPSDQNTMVVKVEHKNKLLALIFIHPQDKEKHYFADEKLFIYNVANILTLYFESKQKSKVEFKLFKQYYFDAPTQLPNKQHLHHQLTILMNSHPVGAILLFEIANLLSVNNIYGRQTGDDLVLHLSRRLQHSIQPNEFIARAAQNRFAILSFGEHLEDITKRLTELFQYISQPFKVKGQELIVPLDGGIACYPKDAQTPHTLLECAEQAVQIANQKQPAGTLLFFENTLRETLTRQQEIGHSLHSALKKQELSVHFQPFINAKTFSLQGAEALVRWNNTQFGIISPEDFIPLAEEAGIITEIGLWVLEQACYQAAKWQNKYSTHFTIAVNVSPKQLVDPLFSDKVINILDQTGLQRSFLELEITEMVASQENPVIDKNVNELIAHGIGFAIDDFGSGYASFHYIKRFATKKIKIDRKFTENICLNTQDKDLVKVIVAMGHALNAKVTAEGISTLEQLLLMENIGCDYVQGYFIGKPLPADEFENVFRSVQ
ncbi:putative bifunctional diguanylate cyclase/phosphodiesterase [Neisseria sp. Ec49-e6-T10]|uniref:putative bifunctional diguanylate cyclase/phosphodiesterase n=1 Tax=Neisseria sp. Ec49-e6-T10 TaxID=3140744 RepID=UPI003EBE045B